MDTESLSKTALVAPTATIATDSLNKLPPELKIMILNACDYATFRALRCTNHAFNTAASAAQKRAILINTEHSHPYALPDDNYICLACERIRNSFYFAEEETGGVKTHGGVCATSRICLPCGLVKGIYWLMEDTKK
ncbi:MAG: hypothetical protein L6R41_001739 [Letrouitia leprolyta]|nr:MAG: hypothetical protein L6R41_001739 [Letrouitia leprolyta]